MNYAQTLANEFNIREAHSQNIINLIEEGNTIPFIARYRKELTGSIDDQVLRELADRYTYLKNLEKRKGEIISSITEQGKMTDELASQIENATTQTELEDIYRPYKPKRKTRASEAIKKGLQPLADFLLKEPDSDPSLEAEKFVTEEVKSAADALQGAKDIIAEVVSDDPELRKTLRNVIHEKANITCVLDEEKENASTYETYKNYSEEVKKIPSHRILAINRGENEDCLKVKIELNPNSPSERYIRNTSKKTTRAARYSKKLLTTAMKDFSFQALNAKQEAALQTWQTSKQSRCSTPTFALFFCNHLLRARLCSGLTQLTGRAAKSRS